MEDGGAIDSLTARRSTVAAANTATKETITFGIRTRPSIPQERGGSPAYRDLPGLLGGQMSASQALVRANGAADRLALADRRVIKTTAQRGGLAFAIAQV